MAESVQEWAAARVAAHLSARAPLLTIARGPAPHQSMCARRPMISWGSLVAAPDGTCLHAHLRRRSSTSRGGRPSARAPVERERFTLGRAPFWAPDWPLAAARSLLSRRSTGGGRPRRGRRQRGRRGQLVCRRAAELVSGGGRFRFRSLISNEPLQLLWRDSLRAHCIARRARARVAQLLLVGNWIMKSN